MQSCHVDRLFLNSCLEYYFPRGKQAICEVASQVKNHHFGRNFMIIVGAVSAALHDPRRYERSRADQRHIPAAAQRRDTDGSLRGDRPQLPTVRAAPKGARRHLHGVAQ